MAGHSLFPQRGIENISTLHLSGSPMTLASVLSRPRHCALAALFWGMLYHNNIINPRGPKGAKKEKKL